MLSFFKTLGVQRNKSDSWSRVKEIDLTIDLAIPSLCGTALGDAFVCLSGFGPSDRVQHRDKYYRYAAVGISLNEASGRLSAVTVAVSRLGAIKPFAGQWLFSSREISIHSQTQPEEVISLLGTPTSSWNDGVERCFEFELNVGDYEFLWDSSMRLQYINLTERFPPGIGDWTE